MLGFSTILQVPAGDKITVNTDGSLNVPNNPIIPFIEGDGTGPDIWRSSVRVFDAAVQKTYGGRRKVSWFEIFAGAKALSAYGDDCPPNLLPDETVEAIKKYNVAIKGPLTTPVGKGIRSLNVALRQKLDLYVCLRPVRYFDGVPSPVKRPELVDMVIFRENTEDIYAGIEWEEGNPEVKKVMEFLTEMNVINKVRFPDSAAIGIKPVTREGTARLVRAAIKYAIANDRKSVTLVHKGNIMKFTEGAFMRWGYEVARDEFAGKEIDGGPWLKIEAGTQGNENDIIIKDFIADAFLQQILTRPAEYDVIATLNLNGDYISDALAAQVGGIGIAPGGNINYVNGLAIFEATHGTAPKYAGLDKVNPGSVILSGVMMFRYLGWKEVADLIIKGLDGAIKGKVVTYDFARLMEGAKEVKCSEFGDEIIKQISSASLC